MARRKNDYTYVIDWSCISSVSGNVKLWLRRTDTESDRQHILTITKEEFAALNEALRED